MKSGANNLTVLLKDAMRGNDSALEKVWPVVYEEIHRLAQRYMRKEKAGNTLQPTALVNEAFIRLSEGKKIDWQDRHHFFAIAARVMRRVIIDHANAKNADKRGAGNVRITFDEELHWAETDSTHLLEIDKAMEKLAKVDPRLAQVVELRYFGGMNVEEAAQVLNISAATVKRDWAMAKIWLYRELSEKEKP